MKANINSQTKYICMVDRKTNVQHDIKRITAFLDSIADRYALIEHKADISTATFEVESPHIHIVMELPKRKRLSTILRSYVLYMDYSSDYGIEIDNANDLVLCYQYLIHKNDKDKTSHDISEVITNIDSGEFALIMSSEQGTLTIDSIFDTFEENAYVYKAVEVRFNFREIAKKLGRGNIQCNSLLISWAMKSAEWLLKERYFG